MLPQTGFLQAPYFGVAQDGAAGGMEAMTPEQQQMLAQVMSSLQGAGGELPPPRLGLGSWGGCSWGVSQRTRTHAVAGGGLHPFLCALCFRGPPLPGSFCCPTAPAAHTASAPWRPSTPCSPMQPWPPALHGTLAARHGPNPHPPPSHHPPLHAAPGGAGDLGNLLADPSLLALLQQPQQPQPGGILQPDLLASMGQGSLASMLQPQVGGAASTSGR